MYPLRAHAWMVEAGTPFKRSPTWSAVISRGSVSAPVPELVSDALPAMALSRRAGSAPLALAAHDERRPRLGAGRSQIQILSPRLAKKRRQICGPLPFRSGL